MISHHDGAEHCEQITAEEAARGAQGQLRLDRLGDSCNATFVAEKTAGQDLTRSFAGSSRIRCW
jgi:hypothetical protein